MSDAATLAQRTLLQKALAYPGAAEDHPWDHTVVKVPGKKGKIFIFVDASGGSFHLTAKLPASRHAALSLPFTEPTGYGLGKSGWISASFDPGEEIPVDLLVDWLDESYRAVAPKKLVKALDGGAPAGGSGAARRGALARPAAARRGALARPATSKKKTSAKKKAPARKKTPARKRAR